MKKSKRGRWMILCGLLLIMVDIVWIAYNLYEANRAQAICQRDIRVIEEQITQYTSSEQKKQIAIYEVFPEVEMPVVRIEDKEYIGTIRIPTLELELPVQTEWSYPKLKQTPCRYKGSVYQDNLIVAAHNYAKHFGKIDELDLQEQLIFTDLAGNIFYYEVSKIEVLPGTALEEMESGDWDLTLFTCTYGGQSRVVVRCERVESAETGK